MKNQNILIVLSWNILIFGLAIAYPDTYEVEDTNTNEKINLLQVLPTHSKKVKGRKNPQNDPHENWAGRWFPSRPNEWTPPPKIQSTRRNMTMPHEKMPMGVRNSTCDDGKTNLTVDWDHSPASYSCFGQEIQTDFSLKVEKYHKSIPKYYQAMHACMSEPITYEDEIPLYGTHRAIWPVYGEYKYVPKQRWLHSLEHGAVVMLYHPCANSSQVQLLKKIVRSCLWRHIITPDNVLDVDRAIMQTFLMQSTTEMQVIVSSDLPYQRSMSSQGPECSESSSTLRGCSSKISPPTCDQSGIPPMALLTWGYQMSMSHVETSLVKKFIRKRALRGPENIYRDGHFNYSILEKADIVSDEKDSKLCPELHM